MKKLVLMLALGFAVIAANAQKKKTPEKVKETDVPSAVKNSLLKKYPNTKVEKWQRLEGNRYEAVFDFNKKETLLIMDASGNIIETETMLKTSELPKEVIDYCDKKFPGKKIKEASKRVDANGKLMYEAEINETNLLFDQYGKFIKEEKEEYKD